MFDEFTGALSYHAIATIALAAAIGPPPEKTGTGTREPRRTKDRAEPRPQSSGRLRPTVALGPACCARHEEQDFCGQSVPVGGAEICTGLEINAGVDKRARSTRAAGASRSLPTPNERTRAAHGSTPLRGPYLGEPECSTVPGGKPDRVTIASA